MRRGAADRLVRSAAIAISAICERERSRSELALYRLRGTISGCIMRAVLKLECRTLARSEPFLAPIICITYALKC
jgi:hypothetical protein